MFAFVAALLCVAQGFAMQASGARARLMTTHGRQRQLALRRGSLMFADADFKQQRDAEPHDASRRVDDELRATGGAPSALSAAASATAIYAALLTGAPALAATEAAGAVPSALVAYAHFVSLLVIAMCLLTERLSIKPDMTEDDFDRAVTADIGYGIAGVVLTVSGYLRVTAYAKGWEFYAHEPVFWLKMLLFAVMGASSFFPTVKLTQRAIAKRKAAEAGVAMLSPKLIKRMTSIINAELLALLAIPLSASLMARGVGYSESLAWQVGAAPAVLALTGLGFKYAKEAVTWSDE